MKLFNIFLVFLLLMSACKDAKIKPEKPLQQEEEPTFAVAGAPISEGTVFSEVEMTRVYSELQPGDTVTTRFEGEVLSVCQMKGCWMRVDMPGKESVMVRFKDYGFFVPKDLAGERVMLEGRAFVSEVGEAERRHIAADAGQPDSLIAKISGSDMQMGFEATGVRIFR